MAKKKAVEVTLQKSPLGGRPKQKRCLIGLGLRRMHQAGEVEDSPSVRGMIKKVNYMVSVENEG